MIPVRIPDYEIPEGYTRKLWAAHQQQYEPLPSLDGPYDGEVLARWHLSENERRAVLDGADIELRIYTYGHPLQPHWLEIQGTQSDEPPPREQVILENPE